VPWGYRFWHISSKRPKASTCVGLDLMVVRFRYFAEPTLTMLRPVLSEGTG
jgi:hypothetical protein